MPMLVRWSAATMAAWCRAASCAPANWAGCEANNPDWKTLAYDENSGQIVVPNGSIGFRWGEKGKWNLEEKASKGADAPAPEPGRGHDGIERWLPVLRRHRAMAGPLHRPMTC
jgi:nitrate reductase alpha subunit